MSVAEGAKRYLSGILRDAISHPPSCDNEEFLSSSFSAVDPISYVSSCLRLEEVQEVAIETIIHDIITLCLKDSFKLSFSKFRTDLESAHVESCDPMESCDPSPMTSLWIMIGRFSPDLPYLTPLHQLSTNINTLLHTFTELGSMHSYDPTSLFNTACHDMWYPAMISQVELVEREMIDILRCVRSLALCLATVQVTRDLSEAISLPWLCKECLSKIIDNLDRDYPTVLYQEYVKLEAGDVHGGRSCCVDVRGGGMIFKSVQFITDSLCILATVAKECGYQKLLETSSECTLRLFNKSWQHLQQLSKQVPHYLSLKVNYLVLGSILTLHRCLKHISIHPNQRKSCDDLLFILSEQIVSLKDHVIRYHHQLCITSLLHDGDSSDWKSNRCFYEGERCSFSIQMWAYHMRGLHHDLCTYLPSEFYPLSEGVVVGVLEACLSHMVTHYSQISPLPKKVPLYIADTLLILSSVASILWPPCTLNSHQLISRQLKESSHMQSINVSCNLICCLIGIVTCSLPQLHEILSDEIRKVGGSLVMSCEWLSWLQMHQHLLVREEVISSATLSLPLPHPSRRGLMLQAFLSRGGALSLEFLSQNEETRVILCFLYILSECPHSVWVLSAMYTRLLMRKTECPSNKKLMLKAFRTILQYHLNHTLHRYLVTKATCFHSNSQDMDKSCHTLLEDLEQLIHSHLPCPLLALLYCMAGDIQDSLSLGEKVAKVICSVLNELDSSHLYHTLHQISRHILCYALDPLNPSNPLDHLTPQLCQLLEVHKHHLSQKRKTLHSIFDPLKCNTSSHDPSIKVSEDPLSVDPLTMAMKELESCTLIEHEVAVAVICTNQKGKYAFNIIEASVLRRINPLRDTFNPLREYVNVGVQDQRMLSQQKLMTVGDVIDTDKSCEHFISKNVFKLIKKVRWEWQEGVSSELEPADLRLMEAINQLTTKKN